MWRPEPLPYAWRALCAQRDSVTALMVPGGAACAALGRPAPGANPDPAEEERVRRVNRIRTRWPVRPTPPAVLQGHPGIGAERHAVAALRGLRVTLPTMRPASQETKGGPSESLG